MNENKKSKISIITVVFNGGKFLERAILSVLNQTYRNIEYIVIDGGSTDGSLDIIKKYRDKIAYWVSEPDKGIGDAMNKGIKKATGDWILILNSDDYYISSDAIKKAAEYPDDSGKNFYYFTIVHEFPASGKRKIYKRPIYWFNRFALYYSAYIPHLTLWVMKKQYEEVGPYDTNFKIAGDHDLILRLMKRHKPVFIDMPLTVMTMGGVSAVNPEKTFKEFRDATVKNGTPKLLAELIFRFKIWKHKLLKIDNQ